MSARGAINAADLAVSEDELDTAEKALLLALSEVRKAKAGDPDAS